MKFGLILDPVKFFREIRRLRLTEIQRLTNGTGCKCRHRKNVIMIKWSKLKFKMCTPPRPSRWQTNKVAFVRTQSWWEVSSLAIFGVFCRADEMSQVKNCLFFLLGYCSSANQLQNKPKNCQTWDFSSALPIGYSSKRRLRRRISRRNLTGSKISPNFMAYF